MSGELRRIQEYLCSLILRVSWDNSTALLRAMILLEDVIQALEKEEEIWWPFPIMSK
jgi:hypothetical protein